MKSERVRQVMFVLFCAVALAALMRVAMWNEIFRITLYLFLGGLSLAVCVSILMYYAYSRRYIRLCTVVGVYEVDSVSRTCVIEVRDATNKISRYIGNGVHWFHYPGGALAGSFMSIQATAFAHWLDKHYLEYYAVKLGVQSKK